MIRVAILADIHGNSPALKAVIEHQRQFDTHLVIVAGDLITDCPDSNEVVSMIASLENCMVIAGNREEYLRQFDGADQDEWRRRKQWSSFVWASDSLYKENRTFLADLPTQMSVQIGSSNLRIVHGSPNYSNDHLYPETKKIAKIMQEIPEGILVCGHTHEQWSTRLNGKIALNPGSVGVHFNRDSNAEYSLLEFGGDHSQVAIKHQQVPYDVEETISRFTKTGLIEHSPVWSHTIIQSLKTGKNITMEFLGKAIEMEKEITGGEVIAISNNVWKKAAKEYLGITI
ncbi:MAG: metallophosphoesterase family protein [Spirochaetales bacterium]|jgi:putative phosphoesterase|nr:metallophosphoesterase family protein [Spirochaetales bacterium]